MANHAALVISSIHYHRSFSLSELMRICTEMWSIFSSDARIFHGTIYIFSSQGSGGHGFGAGANSFSPKKAGGLSWLEQGDLFDVKVA
jgi:hypothetical protein